MYAVNWHDTGHIGIHGGMEFDDVMAIKPRFLATIGYHIFLTMVLRARSSTIIIENFTPVVCS